MPDEFGNWEEGEEPTDHRDHRRDDRSPQEMAEALGYKSPADRAVAIAIERYRARPGYSKLSASGQQAVDLYAGDRVAWIDIPEDAREFLRSHPPATVEEFDEGDPLNPYRKNLFGRSRIDEDSDSLR